MQNGRVNISLIKFNAIIKLLDNTQQNEPTPRPSPGLEETYHEIKVFMWGEFHRRHHQEDNQILNLPGKEEDV